MSTRSGFGVAVVHRNPIMDAGLRAFFESQAGMHVVRTLNLSTADGSTADRADLIVADYGHGMAWLQRESDSQAGADARVCSRKSLYSLAFASFWLSTFQLSLSSYMTTYLHDAFGYSLVTAGATMSAAQVAGVTGRIAWGAIADRWLGSVRMLIVLSFGMVVGACVLAVLGGDVPSWLPAAVVVTVSAFSLGWNGTFLAEVTRQAPAGTAGRATGAILACTFAGVVVGPPLFGTIASMTGSYRTAFAIALIGPAIAGILLTLRRPAFDV